MSEHLIEAQPHGPLVLAHGVDFMDHFGVEANPLYEQGEFRKSLRQLDPRYTGGRDLVRWQLEADQNEWDETTVSIIHQTAKSMRMLETETPLKGNFDATIVLGGARRSNLDRMEYAAQAIKAGETRTKHLVIAGSTRELSKPEQDIAADYAPGAITEFDLCVGAAAKVAEDNPGLIVGSMCVGDQKAGTPAVLADVLHSLSSVGSLVPGSRVAAVTTQIYQVSTALDLSVVARGFDVTETYAAGNPSDPNVIARRTTATYLSEILRTLRAAVDDTEMPSDPICHGC